MPSTGSKYGYVLLEDIPTPCSLILAARGHEGVSQPIELLEGRDFLSCGCLPIVRQTPGRELGDAKAVFETRVESGLLKQLPAIVTL